MFKFQYRKGIIELKLKFVIMNLFFFLQSASALCKFFVIGKTMFKMLQAHFKPAFENLHFD